jgi:hypothetical protein
MFNRRHYEFVAGVIKEQRAETSSPSDISLLAFLTWRFADKFKADNALFDADKFFNATVDGVVRRPRKA